MYTNANWHSNATIASVLDANGTPAQCTDYSGYYGRQWDDQTPPALYNILREYCWFRFETARGEWVYFVCRGRVCRSFPAM